MNGFDIIEIPALTTTCINPDLESLKRVLTKAITIQNSRIITSVMHDMIVSAYLRTWLNEYSPESRPFGKIIINDVLHQFRPAVIGLDKITFDVIMFIDVSVLNNIKPLISSETEAMI